MDHCFVNIHNSIISKQWITALLTFTTVSSDPLFTDDTVVDFNNEPTVIVENKGNKKITELRTILQRESQNS
jgi:ribosomal protein L14